MCPWGKCPGGYMSRGFCPVTREVMSSWCLQMVSRDFTLMYLSLKYIEFFYPSLGNPIQWELGFTVIVLMLFFTPTNYNGKHNEHDSVAITPPPPTHTHSSPPPLPTPQRHDLIRISVGLLKVPHFTRLW